MTDGRSSVAVAAVDLGGSSGRVIVGRVGEDTLELTESWRFPNRPVLADGTLHWNILGLYDQVLDGLRRAGPVRSIGIDSWGVDYGLLDADGRLLSDPVHYRDARTAGVMENVVAEIGAEDLYELAGLQLLPFNTIFQLVAAKHSAQLAAAKTLLLIPDLLAYWLTLEIGAERTNASTTGLLGINSGTWLTSLIERLGLNSELLPSIREPGAAVGRLVPAAAEAIGASTRTQVTAVASHDTASSVVAVPAMTDTFAYISCGTWSLVGLELPAPVLTRESRAANFTNEVGVDGTIRYLRNVMGLWPLQECVREWRANGVQSDLAPLLTVAAAVEPFLNVVDLNDPIFLPPGDMPARIVASCQRLGQAGPTTQAEVVRCILDSLALAHRRAVHDAQRLAHRTVDIVHLVGGGARNPLLCQMTADACQLPVAAGPEEATAIGNVLIQARALGVVDGSLPHLRALVQRTHPVRLFEPQRDPGGRWAEASDRISPHR